MAANNNRPLSPHLQIYKLPLTGIISITHRITGVLLSAGLIFVVYLLLVLTNGPDAYAAMQAVMAMGLIRALYWGFLFALFLHLCHGVRHLIWDTGKGFELETLNRYAAIELIASIGLTLLTYILVR